MPVFFAFSDESGKYKKERSNKLISKNRTCLKRILENTFTTDKKDYLISLEAKLKKEK